MTSHADILQISEIEVIYEKVILGVKNVSLNVKQGAIVALLGANGAGKSTTLKAISGLIRAERGEITQGQIYYNGAEVKTLDTGNLVELGMVQVLEGRHCFSQLSVEENLSLGALIKKPSAKQLEDRLERIYDYFPRLRLLRKKQAGYISGGEQQMVAIGRALMASPTLVLLDEPSMGLAPLVVEEIFEIINELNKKEGVSFLLSEQNATLALHYSDYGYILENGRIAAQGSANELRDNSSLDELYLGGLSQ